MTLVKFVLRKVGLTRIFVKYRFKLRFLNFFPYFSALNGQKFRKQLVLDILKNQSINIICETGTYLGVTTEFFAKNFSGEISTCEINKKYYLISKRHLKKFDKKVSVVNLDSLDALPIWAEKYSSFNTFFYLDAHWYNHLPLKEELLFIIKNFQKFIILIDDFKVPFDNGYNFDSYGVDKEISLDYLNFDEMKEVDVLFPDIPSKKETGMKCGYCVIVRKRDTDDFLSRNTHFRKY